MRVYCSRDVGAEGGILWLAAGDVDLSADAYEAEELRSDVFVEADAAMAGGAMFDPACVDAVVGFELAPIGHGGSDEGPAWWFLVDFGLASVAAFVSPAVRVGALAGGFVKDFEIAVRCGAACANIAGGDQQGFAMFQNVDHLLAGGDFYRNRSGIGGQGSWSIVFLVLRDGIRLAGGKSKGREG